MLHQPEGVSMFDWSRLRKLVGPGFLFFVVLASAAESGTLRGTVTDPLGAVIVSATVELLDGASQS